MAKNYTKKPAAKSHARGWTHGLWIVSAFIVGYMTSAMYDLPHLQRWVAKQWVMYHQPPLVLHPVAQKVALPKPNFEFYTLLAKEPHARVVSKEIAQVAAPPHAPVATKKIVAVASQKQASYVVQIASFKQLREAERLKVALLMKGFDVSITDTKQQNLHWYRVNMGPFYSKQDAQKAQMAFARRQHILGMIRPMMG